MNQLEVRNSTEEFLIFKINQKDKGIETRYENGNLWMTQKSIAELFDVNVPAINKHLNNIYDDKELLKDSTTYKTLL